MEPYNVLVVDDEVPVLNTLRRTLRREYNIFSATNGEDALTIMEGNDIDLIIADYRMPGMDGIELLEKALRKYPDTIRIILTAYTSEELLIDSINTTHVHSFIAKPWDPEEVKSTVRKWKALESAREQAEAKLRESEKKYRLLVENSGNAISVVNSDGVFLLLNNMAAMKLGGEVDDLTGKSLYDIFPQEEADDYMAGIRGVIESGTGYTSERMVRLPSGAKWFSSNVQPITDSNGKASCVQVISQDITERKAAETQLITSEKLASIGRLSANLAHELGNPLDGSLRYVRLLINQISETDPRRIYAERARDGLIRMANMVNGVLDFAKKSTSKLTPIDTPQCIGRVLSFFNDQISAQNIEIKTKFDENIPIAFSSDVEHIFLNIIKNAIQAMPDGGTLSINARMLSPQVFEARFSDTGSGIPHEIQRRIFEPFFTTRSFEKGVGLGLSISQEIAKRHGGSIDLEVRSGKGTTFIVTLRIKKGRILVMDDEKHVRDLAGEMLSNIGYGVTTSREGAEAIELYEEAKSSGYPYDAVILDLVVPDGMNGKETIQKLKEIDPEVKAIVSSGYPDDPTIIDFEKHGFKGVAAKPYRVQELSDVLSKVINPTD